MKVVPGQDEFERMKEEARHIYFAAPVLFPLLSRRRSEAFDRLMASFRQGKADNLTIVAELSVISDIERELKTKLQFFEAQEAQNANRTK